MNVRRIERSADALLSAWVSMSPHAQARPKIAGEDGAAFLTGQRAGSRAMALQRRALIAHKQFCLDVCARPLQGWKL